MSNIFHRWNDLKRLQAGEMIAPNFVDLHLSDVCNQNCSGCAFKSDHENRIMPEDKFMVAANTLMDNGVKSFAFCGGGEPCCAKYLVSAWEHIHSRGCHFAMLTNGSLLNLEMIETMIKYGTFVRISLEASNATDYSKYKRVPTKSWYQVLDNIKQLVARKKQTGSQCSVGIKFAVCKTLRGQNHYDDGLNLANELGVDRVTFRAIRGVDEELEPAESLGENELLDDSIALLSPRSRVARSLVKAGFNKIPQCWLNPIHTVMNWKGDLFICCYYYFRRNRHLIGNIFEQDFKEMWYSEEHKDLIKNINRFECHKVDCKFFAYHDEFAETDKVGSLYLV
jgi:sulfatase maturation enzyme AslB (radical SAM superfamily)